MPLTENANVQQAPMSIALGPSIAPSAETRSTSEAFGKPGAGTRLFTASPNAGYLVLVSHQTIHPAAIAPVAPLTQERMEGRALSSQLGALSDKYNTAFEMKR